MFDIFGLFQVAVSSPPRDEKHDEPGSALSDAANGRDDEYGSLPRGVRVIRIVLIAMAIECAAIVGLVMHVLQGQC